MNEDEHDIRTKFNLGTASCIHPMDFNDPSMFDDEKDPLAVAPAKKNKLSSLLTDQSIEKLAFPHLFPDGQGSFDACELHLLPTVSWRFETSIFRKSYRIPKTIASDGPSKRGREQFEIPLDERHDLSLSTIGAWKSAVLESETERSFQHESSARYSDILRDLVLC